MKFFKNTKDIPKLKIRPDQEARIALYCINKHLLAHVVPTPFCILYVKVKCKICGEIAEWDGMEMELDT